MVHTDLKVTVEPPPQISLVEEKKKKKKKTRKYYPGQYRSFSRYIRDVAGDVHPNIRISKKGMSVLNAIANNVFERVTHEGCRMVNINKRSTLTSRDIQSACKMILPGELAKHAVSEGAKAIINFNADMMTEEKEKPIPKTK